MLSVDDEITQPGLNSVDHCFNASWMVVPTPQQVSVPPINCKVILCAKVVDGKRHDRCAEHSEEAADKGYAGSPPSKDQDDSDDPGSTGRSDSRSPANLNNQDTGKRPTSRSNQSQVNEESTTKRSRFCDLAQAQFLDVAAEALQQEVNGETTMHWMDPIRLRFNNHANVKVCPVYNSSPANLLMNATAIR